MWARTSSTRAEPRPTRRSRSRSRSRSMPFLAVAHPRRTGEASYPRGPTAMVARQMLRSWMSVATVIGASDAVLGLARDRDPQEAERGRGGRGQALRVVAERPCRADVLSQGCCRAAAWSGEVEARADRPTERRAVDGIDHACRCSGDQRLDVEARRRRRRAHPCRLADVPRGPVHRFVELAERRVPCPCLALGPRSGVECREQPEQDDERDRARDHQLDHGQAAVVRWGPSAFNRSFHSGLFMLFRCSAASRPSRG